MLKEALHVHFDRERKWSTWASRLSEDSFQVNGSDRHLASNADVITNN
jgi:hypothetical protein